VRTGVPARATLRPSVQVIAEGLDERHVDDFDSVGFFVFLIFFILVIFSLTATPFSLYSTHPKQVLNYDLIKNQISKFFGGVTGESFLHNQER